jgi:AraC-like DNA-binding protein
MGGGFGPTSVGETFGMARKVRKTTISVPVHRAAVRSAAERRVLELLESGLAYNISDLAARLHLSPSHLQRIFKRETAVCLGEWLIEQRLQKAAYLLANSHLCVKEIAGAAGYEHVSSFIRAFERRYVLTPTSYRERANAGSADAGGSAVPQFAGALRQSGAIAIDIPAQ